MKKNSVNRKATRIRLAQRKTRTINKKRKIQELPNIIAARIAHQLKIQADAE